MLKYIFVRLRDCEDAISGCGPEWTRVDVGIFAAEWDNGDSLVARSWPTRGAAPSERDRLSYWCSDVKRPEMTTEMATAPASFRGVTIP